MTTQRSRLLPAVFLVALIVLVGLILYWATRADSAPSWTGFGAYDEDAHGPRAKTLWDWLGLLIVPAVLALGAIWFNKTQKETELRIADEARKAELQIAEGRQRQATLEAYYDRMTELLLEHGLRKSEPDSEVRSIAKARTIAVVKSLDKERNKQLFSFLITSELITAKTPVIDLRGADLEGSDLRGVSLGSSRNSHLWIAHAFVDNSPAGIDLAGANLALARLDYANLSGVNLREVDLGKASLVGCDLRYSNLRLAHIRSADFANARLDYANLSGVKGWSIRQIEKASTLNGATMPDGVTVHGFWENEQVEPISETRNVDTSDNLTEEEKEERQPSFYEWRERYLAKGRREDATVRYY